MCDGSGRSRNGFRRYCKPRARFLIPDPNIPQVPFAPQQVLYLPREPQLNKEPQSSHDESLSQRIYNKDVCTCVACEQILTFPIQLVEDLGNVCNPCFKKMNILSTKIRNEALENVLKELTLPCNFTQFGCTEKLPYEQILEHHDSCTFKIESCFFDYCSWNGKLDSINQHAQENHSQHVINGDQSFVFNLRLNKDGDLTKLIRGEHSSIVKIRIDFANNVLKFLVFEAGAKSKTVQVCNFELLGSNDKKKSFRLNELPYAQIFKEDAEGGFDLDLKNLRKDLGISEFVPVVIRRLTKKDGFYEKMRKNLECPVCFNVMKAPIYQCTQGHSICGDCDPKLQVCPICGGGTLNDRQKFTRNRALEDLAETYQFDL